MYKVKLNHWTDSHITQDTNGMYIGWDESGTEIISRNQNYQIVKEELISYAERIYYMYNSKI